MGVSGIVLSKSTDDEESLKSPNDNDTEENDTLVVECVLVASRDVVDNVLVVTGSSEGPSAVV